MCFVNDTDVKWTSSQCIAYTVTLPCSSVDVRFLSKFLKKMCCLCIFAQGFELGPDLLCTWREASSNSVAPGQSLLSLLLTWSCCSPPAHGKKTFLQLSSFTTLAVREDDLLGGFASYFASGLLCVSYLSWWTLLAQERCVLMLTLGCLFTLYRAITGLSSFWKCCDLFRKVWNTFDICAILLCQYAVILHMTPYKS